MSIQHGPITGDFVSPEFCQHLHVGGLTDKTNFVWKVINGLHILWTTDFDPDNYYAKTENWLNEFNKAKILPAYTMSRLEKCLPVNYLMERTSLGYTISLDQLYQIPSVRNERLPDAVAMCVLQMLRKKTFQPEYFNKILAVREKV